MMEQEEIVQDKKDDVVNVEAKDEEKEHNEKEAKRKQQVYNATMYFVLGLFLIFAPTYIQTTIDWIVNTSVIICIVCWGVSFNYIHEAYPSLHRNVNVIMGVCFLFAILLYATSEFSAKLLFDPSFKVELRIGSFICLLAVVALLMDQFSEITAFFTHYKGKIKAFFTAKHTIAVILGILSVGTALFQFVQILLQIFH